METIWQDIRYGARMLLTAPGFAIVAIITLAVAIGANTAIFTVVNAVLLRPLPYPHADRLMAVLGHDTKVNDNHNYLSVDDFRDHQQTNQSFEQLGCVTPPWEFTLSGAGDSERIKGFWSSASMFPLLGMEPVLGRGFTEEEDRVGGPPVVVLTYGLWQRKFGGNREIIGRNITLSGESLTVVGVLPAGFRWLEPADVWLPMSRNSVVQRGRAVRTLFFVGRLKLGVTQANAKADLDAIAARLEQQYPESNRGIGVNVVSLAREFSWSVRPVLLALLGAVVLVLLIACANVANLLLARGRTRAREIAVRVALGATRSRLITQLLTESILMAVLAGLAGLLLAFWGVDLLLDLSPVDLSRRGEIGIDKTALLFTFLLSALTGIIFGLLPALKASRSDLTVSLKEGSRGSVGPAHQRTLKVLVVSEVALSLVVMIAAGLLVRSWVNLQRVDPGFNIERVLSFDLPVPQRYSQDTNLRLSFYKDLYQKIEALPGVVAVGDVTRLPLAGRAGNPTTLLAIEGSTTAPGDRPQVDFRRAGHDYFKAMGISTSEGRVFNDRDTPQTEPVAIINQVAARRFFAGQNPVGGRIGFGNAATPQWSRIVGVVGDVRHVALHVEPRPEVYIASSQAPPFAPVMVVRTTTDESALVPAIRSVIRQIDPDVPIFNVMPLQTIRYQSLAHPRFQVLVFGLFGVVALFLAVVGVYAVMAYSVSQRTNELGIRLALGASGADVMRLVVGEGAKLAAVGVVIGIPVAVITSRLLADLLFRVKPADVVTYAAVALVLGLIAVVACYVPARRAARVDPMVALREG